MNTKICRINPKQFKKEELKEPAGILRNGGLVAFPTETVYGLGGDGLRKDAAKKIYEAKGRPSDNPLIIHIGHREDLDRLAKEIPEKAKKLAEAYWPGPLTMIFKKKEMVPYETTGGLDTVAVRMPEHPVALALIQESGVLIAAPSANTSGRPSPTRASHVMDDLSGQVDMIIDGGEVGIGIESTIVDVTEDIPVILRPGYITREMLEDVVGPVKFDQAVLTKREDPDIKPKAPGMRYKHYAPKADLVIYEGELEAVIRAINTAAEEVQKDGKKAGIIATEETKRRYTNADVVSAGTRTDEDTIAHNLFRILRDFDDADVDFIYSESFTSDRLGQAIMNRLLKAAGYQVIHVSS